MTKNYVLALDQGTTSSRTVRFNIRDHCWDQGLIKELGIQTN